MEGSGLSASSKVMHVLGKKYNDGTVGETCPYDAAGRLTSSFVHTDWSAVMICMNNDPDIYKALGDPLLSAQKTFIHEVGHSLKLAHPTKNPSVYGHNLNGYPYAVMNQGAADITGKIPPSPRPTWHDSTCLKYKWGD